MEVRSSHSSSQVSTGSSQRTRECPLSDTSTLSPFTEKMKGKKDEKTKKFKRKHQTSHVKSVQGTMPFKMYCLEIMCHQSAKKLKRPTGLRIDINLDTC